MNSASNTVPPRRLTSPSSQWPGVVPKLLASEPDETTRELRKGETLTLTQPAGHAVLCSHGVLWITCQPADDGAGRLQIHAVTDACVSVVPGSRRP